MEKRIKVGLVVLLLVAAPVAGAAIQAGFIGVSNNSSGLPVQVPDGPSATIIGDFDLSTETGAVDSSTLQYNTSVGNATFEANGDASTTLPASSLDGDWVNLSQVDATNAALTVRTGEVAPATISGDVDQLRYPQASKIDATDNQVDFYLDASGSGEITLRNLPASTTLWVETAGSGQTLDRVTTDASGTATIDVQSTNGLEGVYLYANSPPNVDDSSLTPNTTASTVDLLPITLEANVSDPDLGSVSGESLTVEWYVNGSKRGETSVSSNGTTSFTLDNVVAGEHSWHVEVVDDAGERTTSASAEFATPAELEVFNESAPTELVDNTSLRIRFFGAGDEVVERTVSDGKLNMTGLPVGQRFVVSVSDDNNKFYYRRIVLESLYEQSEIYLLPRTIDGAEVEFVLQDYTGGEFAPADTTLFIEAPINKDFDGDGDAETRYQNVFGDNFGAAGAFPAVLEANERYRLRIVNDQGNTRVLGSYIATRDEIERITVKGLTFDPPSGQGYETNFSLNNPENDNRTLTWKYIDPNESTTSLDVKVISESGTIIYEDSTDSTLGNYSIYDLTLANDTSYTLIWEATRNGEQLSVERPIGGGALGIDIPLASQWLGTFGMLAVVFTLSLSGARKTTYVAMSAVTMAGILMALKAVAIYPPLWWLGALIAAGSHLRTMQGD